MATASTITTLDSAFKELYSKDGIVNNCYKNNPLLAMLPKFENAGGRYYYQPVLYSTPQSASATFSTAQTGSTTKYSGIKDFNVTRVTEYGVVTVSNEAILASQTDAGAFLQARKLEMDACLQTVTNRIATSLYRTGYGEIGQVTSTAASSTLTLKNAEDIVNFEVGMDLVFASAPSSAALRDSGETLTVVSVNRSAGTMTISSNTVNDYVSDINGIADDDYIFAAGDRITGSGTTMYKIAGLGAWIPSSAPSSTSFFGVDRTADSRLGGLRFDGTTYSIEEALVKAAVIAAKEGAQPDHCFISYPKYADLVNSLGSKVQFVDLKVGAVGFQGLKLYGPAGEMKVIPDRSCPSNRAFILQLDTWKLISLGPVPQILDYDGTGMWVRQASDDGVEIRAGAYNLTCSNPFANVNVQL